MEMKGRDVVNSDASYLSFAQVCNSFSKTWWTTYVEFMNHVKHNVEFDALRR